MGNKLDIFEMVMVTLARGMVKNVQKSSRYDSFWTEKSEDFDFETKNFNTKKFRSKLPCKNNFKIRSSKVKLLEQGQ